MKQKNTYKWEQLSPLQVAGLHNLGDTYINSFSNTIENEMSHNLMSTNGDELQRNLNYYGLSYKRFFSSLEKRIVREFSNVQDAHFDYKGFLSNGIYILHLNYKGQENDTGFSVSLPTPVSFSCPL